MVAGVTAACELSAPLLCAGDGVPMEAGILGHGKAAPSGDVNSIDDSGGHMQAPRSVSGCLSALAPPPVLFLEGVPTRKGYLA